MNIAASHPYLWDCPSKSPFEPELNLGGSFSTVYEDYEMATSSVVSSRRFDLSVGLCSTS